MSDMKRPADFEHFDAYIRWLAEQAWERSAEWLRRETLDDRIEAALNGGPDGQA